MKYYIIEIQTMAGGTCAHLVNTADTRNQAESVYHQILASAAISNLPKHAAAILTNEGFPIMNQCYTHEYIDVENDVEE